jgi:hypothetical protein
MDAEIGKFVVIAITTIGAVAWLAGLAVMLRATRQREARAQQAAERFDIEGEAAAGTIVGEAEVEGQPEELSAKLAKLLARDGMGPLGPVKIVACDRREVGFETAGSTPAGSSGYAAAGLHRGQFRLVPAGSRTRVEYAIETSTGRVLLSLGWLTLVLGLAALAAGCWLEFTYVLPSPNPTVRAQAVQMVHAVHFLWPPFVFAYLSGQPARMLRARLETLVHNLPYA